MRTVFGRLFVGRVHDGFRPGVVGAAIFSTVSLAEGVGAMQPPQSPHVPGVGRRTRPFRSVLACHRILYPPTGVCLALFEAISSSDLQATCPAAPRVLGLRAAELLSSELRRGS
jgi:hypothetical protein